MKFSASLLAFALCAVHFANANPNPAQEIANAPEATPVLNVIDASNVFKRSPEDDNPYEAERRRGGGKPKPTEAPSRTRVRIVEEEVTVTETAKVTDAPEEVVKTVIRRVTKTATTRVKPTRRPGDDDDDNDGRGGRGGRGRGSRGRGGDDDDDDNGRGGRGRGRGGDDDDDNGRGGRGRGRGGDDDDNGRGRVRPPPRPRCLPGWEAANAEALRLEGITEAAKRRLDALRAASAKARADPRYVYVAHVSPYHLISGAEKQWQAAQGPSTAARARADALCPGGGRGRGGDDDDDGRGGRGGGGGRGGDDDDDRRGGRGGGRGRGGDDDDDGRGGRGGGRGRGGDDDDDRRGPRCANTHEYRTANEAATAAEAAAAAAKRRLDALRAASAKARADPRYVYVAHVSPYHLIAGAEKTFNEKDATARTLRARANALCRGGGGGHGEGHPHPHPPPRPQCRHPAGAAARTRADAALRRLQALRAASAKARADPRYVYVAHVSPYHLISGAENVFNTADAEAKRYGC
ncbi:hypothetical protein HGRIS_012496 [Hohenbuehelia grisea]|uniref:Uncharacterized protein n=1 Tax=Hohenbuehelia grisea TaxID=104357 RepID=A0ABR3ISH3_9AGAR